MKREIIEIKPGHNTTGCCPGHDDWPADTYKNNRSKRARSRDKSREHRYVRRTRKQEINKELAE